MATGPVRVAAGVPACRLGLPRLWAAVWRVALFFTAFAVVLAPFFVPMDAQLAAWAAAHSPWARLYPDAVGLGAILLVTVILTRVTEHRAVRSIGLAGPRAGRDFVLGVGWGTVWLAVSLGIAWLAGWVAPAASGPVDWTHQAWAGFSLLLNVVTQQLLLCGFVWQVIQARWGFRPALVTSVILFSAYHAGAFHGAWLPALNVVLAGTVFGFCYRLSGNLWLGIGCHFAWNCLLGQVFGLTVSGSSHYNTGWQSFSMTPNLFTGGSFGFEGGLLVTATTALFVAVMVLLLRRREAGGKRQEARGERQGARGGRAGPARVAAGLPVRQAQGPEQGRGACLPAPD